MSELVDLSGPNYWKDHFGGDRNCWGTPSDLFAELHVKYSFTVDACALSWNTKLPRFWSPVEDGLVQSWAGERVWCNPPYGRGLIEPWVEKALERRAGVAVLLLPSRTDTAWFQALLGRPGVSITFLPKRVRFVPPPGVKASSPTEASILVEIQGERT
jgi:phage N-6-adenine-methyltransferase